MISLILFATMAMSQNTTATSSFDARVSTLCASALDLDPCGFKQLQCTNNSQGTQCGSVFLLRALCAVDSNDDRVSATDCSQVKAFCASNPQNAECNATLAAGLPSSASLAQILGETCASAPPPDFCKPCPALSGASSNATISQCNVLSAFVNLCSPSPSAISSCTVYTPLCSTFPALCPATPTPSPTPTSSMDMSSSNGMHNHGGSSMMGYLHSGFGDNLLFETFVPVNLVQYVGALLFCFSLPIVAAWLENLRGNVIKARKALVMRGKSLHSIKAQIESKALSYSTVPVVDESGGNAGCCAPTTASPLDSRAVGEDSVDGRRYHLVKAQLRAFGTSDTSFVVHQFFKFVLTVVHVILGYLIMLVVMQFNVGYLITVSFGYGVGSLLFENVSDEIVVKDCECCK